jgi:hypothetical protein
MAIVRISRGSFSPDKYESIRTRLLAPMLALAEEFTRADDLHP